jgi:hypothetical protein
LQVQTRLLDRPLTLHYRVGSAGCGVNSVTLNDHSLPFASSNNRYRRGGAVVDWERLRERLDNRHNALRIDIG